MPGGRPAPSARAWRVVFDGNMVTSAGVSAGTDMALELTLRHLGEDYARAIQPVGQVAQPATRTPPGAAAR